MTHENDEQQTRDQIEALNRLAREEAGALVEDSLPVDAVAAAVEEPTDVPKIVLPGEGRTVTAFAMEAGNVCKVNGVYRRDSIPVVVNRESGGIEPLTASKFCTEIEEVALTCVQKVIKMDGQEIVLERPKTMTKATAEVTLAADAFIYRLRKLERVNMVRQPIMRKDGRIDLLPIGYDEESGILTMPNEVEIATRDRLMELDEPSRKQALMGCAAVIRSQLKEFPLVSELDIAVQVSAMMGFYGSLLLPHEKQRLNFVYKANKHRSGKTLLIKTAIVPVMGKAIVQPFPREVARLDELLNSTVLGAKSYLVLDDIVGFLRCEALNAFLTAAWWGGRMMHTQRTFEAKQQATLFLSGHELTLSPDLAGRFLECRLHVEVADSTEARVKRPIDDEYLSRKDVRSELLSALHTIIVLWDLAGRPKGSTVRPGFEEWSRIYGGLVEFAGFVNPCSKRPDDEGTDPEFDDMLALVKDLVSSFDAGDKLKEFTFAQVIERCVDLKAFAWAVEGQWKTEKDSGERWFQMSKKAESKMGWLFGNKYGDTIFQLGDGRRVRFGRQGKNRQRRYVLALI